ncbi:hypothetical protein EGW08_016601, partial [Elysia chlorotica]
MRDEFESSREWKLRKKFLDANVSSLTQDRLICLSKCFINSAMYGCSYPTAVMKEIEMRSCGLLEEYQEEAKEDKKAAAKKSYAVSFVKASDGKSELESDPCQMNLDPGGGNHTLHSPTFVTCKVRLEGKVIGEAEDSNTKAAKSEAARRALEYLGRHCWLLKLKGVDGTSTVSKTELFREIQQRTDDAIGETNLGNRMLRKMGWSGGGVGKDGAGIVEPVAAHGVLGRAGLGLSSSSAPGAGFEERQFRQKVRTALRQYIERGDQEDLRFSPEFSKEERKIIHQEASKLHLRTSSRGKQADRFLTVGHKRSSQQLLQHISECGGETNSHVLLPPGSYQAN